MNKPEPTLEELGLDAPAKISDKISIERLQRESEYELATARPMSSVKVSERSTAMDVLAGIISLIVPGGGHLFKGRIGSALGWFLGTLAVAVLAALIPFGFVLLIVVWILCAASAVVAGD